LALNTLAITFAVRLVLNPDDNAERFLGLALIAMGLLSMGAIAFLLWQQRQ
jgi:cytochrome c biogenesis protein CcdA